MNIIFLEASVPLTKTYTKATHGGVTKTPYPFVWEFTSHDEQCKSLSELEHLLKKHSALGHCALKGMTSRPLVRESRAGSTDTNSTTEWIVLDLDGLPETIDLTTPSGNSQSTPLTIDLFLREMGLEDVSYIVQWSASYGIENQRLRAHVFMLLDKAYSAPLLKQWLIQKNHEVPLLHGSMGLTKTGNSISWPLDISACQNDKLIYIAPPMLKGIKDPMGKTPRISLVKRKFDRLSLSTTVSSSSKNKELNHKRIADLREEAGLPARKITYKMHGNTEVMLKPDECIITEMKTERGFVYFNLNGGDSWAYYHPENAPDYILNFKGEPAYLTKELLPDYWQQLTGSNSSTRTSSNGMTYLAFLDRTSGIYWRGTYDAAADVLDITPAKNETQLRHFAKQYGVPMGDFVPEWDLTFDPNDMVRVDVQNRRVNKFHPTTYMLNASTKMPKAIPKTIFKVMDNALGNDPTTLEHFVNWLATIVQTRDRTRTAWVLHGTQGCLAAETQIEFKRGKRNAGRSLSIKQAYEKWTGQFKQGTGLGKTWDMNLPTFAKSVRDEMTVGYHEVFKIVESGEKQLYRITTTCGRSIRATELHPFMRPDGSFTPLNELEVGQQIVMEGGPINTMLRGGRSKARTTIHSIPHHPHAWKHIINGKNYKRSHRARLVVEADMNGMSLDTFVGILRNDKTVASTLHYLSNDDIVHHRDEDPSNDDLSNLEVINKLNHDQHHAKEVGMGYLATRITKIKSIKKDKVEMTYDLVMKAPYHNYIANGFAVHNTGKGILTSDILRPLFGAHTATRRMEELNEKYNHFMESSFLIFVDEVQTKALQNERGAMAKLKNFITEPMVAIRAMYANAQEVRNYTNWIFMSNMPDPISIDKEDRRINVAKYQPNKLVITDAEVKGIARELQAFYDYLVNYPADYDRAGTVLQSADRDTMISISESSVDTVGSALLEGDFNFFIEQLPTDNSHLRNAQQANKVKDYEEVLRNIIGRTQPNGTCTISREELRTMFDFAVGGMPSSPNKFTSLLKHHRLHLSVVWVNNKSVRGIKTAWKDTAMFNSYVSMHFAPTQTAPAKPATKKAAKVSP